MVSKVSPSCNNCKEEQKICRINISKMRLMKLVVKSDVITMLWLLWMKKSLWRVLLWVLQRKRAWLNFVKDTRKLSAWRIILAWVWYSVTAVWVKNLRRGIQYYIVDFVLQVSMSNVTQDVLCTLTQMIWPTLFVSDAGTSLITGLIHLKSNWNFSVDFAMKRKAF